MKLKKMFWAVKVFSLIGVILALYLLWQQLFHPSFQPCNINQTINCNAIISGPVSKFLGLPTPLFGLVGYIVIFLSAVYKKKKLLLATATFGLVFCLWIAYQEIFLLRVICPVCLLCHVMMISVFILAILINKNLP